ncbi:MAG: Flagellin N-methylase [Spirochaetes bacterium ADurb.Bin269]|nr:MAG: Flagellin N-methylase [Spirochaetes bacterium ADurb.Bin269]
MQASECIQGTHIQELVDGLDRIYFDIETEQAQWKQASPFHCPDGCGTCCVDFEPDVLESEALYLAVWMLHHQKSRAEAFVQGTFQSPRPDPEKGCLFFDPADPYHCTVYEGRCLICRLFGYTGDRGKDGRPRWKPCKYLPIHSPDCSDTRRPQYREAELIDRFGALPPVMADSTSRALSLSPDSANLRRPLREALVIAIRKIQLLHRFLGAPPEPDTPAPNPVFPMPHAS